MVSVTLESAHDSQAYSLIFNDFVHCRIQKDGAVIDTVKLEDPKPAETNPTHGQQLEVKPDESGTHVEKVLVPNLLAQVQTSPQQNLPSNPSLKKTTKLLGTVYCQAKS